MIKFKTKQEIEVMKEGGKKLKNIVAQLKPEVKAGVTTAKIDEKAEALIRNQGGEPSFKRVKGYHWSTCLPVNEQVVHTPPSERLLKKGDVVTLDIGMFYKGFHTDYADTLYLDDRPNPQISNFLAVGKETLYKAIAQARIGTHIGGISKVIEKGIRGKGYFILKELTGHGIGRDLHEAPFVPGFLEKPIEKTTLIKEGLAIAIEVIYSIGTERIIHEKGSDWSIATADGSLSACFEHTIAVLGRGQMILT